MIWKVTVNDERLLLFWYILEVNIMIALMIYFAALYLNSTIVSSANAVYKIIRRRFYTLNPHERLLPRARSNLRPLERTKGLA